MKQRVQGLRKVYGRPSKRVVGLSGNKIGRKAGRKPPVMLAVLLSLVLLASVSVAGANCYLKNSLKSVKRYDLNKDEIVINEGLEEKETALNDCKLVALFGVDDQDNKITDSSRTDCIMVAAINEKTKKISLVSVYRDTYVSINGLYSKVNGAYARGGPELAISTLNRNLDLNITDFVTVNFKALADCVDAVGGIELTVKDSKELKNLNDYIGNMNHINGGNSSKFKEVGTYVFDGNQAVAYARIRYMAGGDHARASHQRLVLSGLFKKLKSNPWKLPDIIKKVLPQVVTSLSNEEIEDIITSAIFCKLNEDNMAAYPFDSKDVKSDGIYYGFPLSVRSNVAKLHAFLYESEDYKVSDELGRIADKVKKKTDGLGL